jgi:bile acid:Na+ symporter, BASS family
MEQNIFIEMGLPISLFIIMMGMGLTLTLADFVREARAPRGVLIGSGAQLLLMPALGFLVAAVFSFSPAIAVGIIIIAACPGGATSNVIAFLARGNVALSIALTAIASLVTIVTLPIYVNLGLGWQLGVESDLRMPVLRTIVMLFSIILVPVALGMVIKAWAPVLAVRGEKAVNVFGALVLLVLIILITYSVRDRIVSLVIQAGVACAALNVAGILAGWLSARFGGLSSKDALTIAIELGIKNATIGMLVAVTLLHSPEMAMPSAVYGLLMYSFGAMLIAYGRRLAGATATPTSTP